MVYKLIFLAAVLFGGCSLSTPFIAADLPSNIPVPPQDSIAQTLFLIGDAGEPISNGIEATFYSLFNQASQAPSISTIIFLGDNIYPRGLPETDHPDRKEMERRLNEQITIAEKSGAKSIFVPGNHDWEYQGKNGWKALVREEKFIASKGLSNVSLLPKAGLPGPAVADIDGNIRIVAIDTQWWLHGFEKPFYGNDTSENQTKKRFLDSLAGILNSSRQKQVIVAAHHPLESYGEHGGFFDWKDHVFPLRKVVSWLWIPLPGIGSLYPLSRMWGISDQDFSGRRNIEMRSALDSVIVRSNVLAYASGHEHALQVLDGRSGQFYLVSGKGIQLHHEALSTGERTIFASPDEGFMRLDFLKNGSVRLGVFDTRVPEGVEIFSMQLR